MSKPRNIPQHITIAVSSRSAWHAWKPLTLDRSDWPASRSSPSDGRMTARVQRQIHQANRNYFNDSKLGRD